MGEMKYKEFLKKLKKCPFCNLEQETIIKQNKHAIITLSRAPYTKDHLLVIPKRHVLRLNELKEKEKRAIDKLIDYGMKLLYKKHKGINILYREGDKKLIAKSIDHLHYNLLPDIWLGKVNKGFSNRKAYSEKEYINAIKKLK